MDTTGRFAVIALLGLLAGVGPLTAAVAPPLAAVPRAAEFERIGEWEKACEAYLRALAEDRDQPEVRERLILCIRHLHQSRRHSDPHFRSRVAGMPLSRALAQYTETIVTLQSSYFDAGKASVDRLYLHGLDELRFAFDDPVFRREHLSGVEPAAIAAFRERLVEAIANPVRSLSDARQAVRDLAWEGQRHTGINPSLLVLECAIGACHGLDEYGRYLLPGQPAIDTASLNDELAAFGLVISGRGDRPMIERIASGSWAASEGLTAGDRITDVGRVSSNGQALDAALDILRGERPLVAELTIRSAATGESRTLKLPSFVPSVQEAVLERAGVGYLRLGSFQKTTPVEFESAILQLRSEGARALVLDLRGNPGGSFTAAVQIAERFLPMGVIVSTSGQLRGLTKTFSAQNPPSLDFPLVVLVDGETASASEVLAGALRDHARATLVGTATSGKDSIQRLMRLSEGGAIRLTLARFLLPGGKPIAGVGIQPQVFEPRRTPMHDFQLEAAIEHAVRSLAGR